MPPVEPGTYRIVNVWSGTCITLRYDSQAAVCWEKSDTQDERWYVQRSGAGYRIQNCSNGMYLAVTETKDMEKDAVVTMFGSQYPTTWELAQGAQDYQMYMVKLAGVDRIIDLYGGSAKNGTKIILISNDAWMSGRRWRFERLSDDTGDEEIKAKNELLVRQEAQIFNKDAELAQLKERLGSTELEVSRLKKELAETSERLATAQDRPLVKDLAALSAEMGEQREESRSVRARLEALEQLVLEALPSNGHDKNNMI